MFDLFSFLCDYCSKSGGNQGEQSVMELKTKLRPHFLRPELFTFILPKNTHNNILSTNQHSYFKISCAIFDFKIYYDCLNTWQNKSVVGVV